MKITDTNWVLYETPSNQQRMGIIILAHASGIGVNHAFRENTNFQGKCLRMDDPVKRGVKILVSSPPPEGCKEAIISVKELFKMLEEEIKEQLNEKMGDF